MGIHSNERQDKIFSMLESRGRMSVSDLAEYFQVTETTIRRDLITMEENHQIVRRRGFAELPLQAASGLRRRNTFQEEKQRIARKAPLHAAPRRRRAWPLRRPVRMHRCSA